MGLFLVRVCFTEFLPGFSFDYQVDLCLEAAKGFANPALRQHMALALRPGADPDDVDIYEVSSTSTVLSGSSPELRSDPPVDGLSSTKEKYLKK